MLFWHLPLSHCVGFPNSDLTPPPLLQVHSPTTDQSWTTAKPQINTLGSTSHTPARIWLHYNRMNKHVCHTHTLLIHLPGYGYTITEWTSTQSTLRCSESSILTLIFIFQVKNNVLNNIWSMNVVKICKRNVLDIRIFTLKCTRPSLGQFLKYRLYCIQKNLLCNTVSTQ